MLIAQKECPLEYALMHRIDSQVRKLILRNVQSPGDIVMLTAAVRDLHKCYPGEFVTDIRTSCPELWLCNPYITTLDENDPTIRIVDCEYPLIHSSNELPYHFIHGFIEHLNSVLGLHVKPTSFHGDIHLSEEEKLLPAGFDSIAAAKYWLVCAGGKFDFTIKWWSIDRFQQVVDHFDGVIPFVQVGEGGHQHLPLRRVVDLRGRTSLRELIRLVYFSSGCISPVSLLMHLSAAVEAPPGRVARRPCVVIAGGREPPQWEAYPTHTFLHTVGKLPCCAAGGCWRSRTVALDDGDEKDNADQLCIDVVGDLPRCMNMITASDVIRAVEEYTHKDNASELRRKTNPRSHASIRDRAGMRGNWAFLLVTDKEYELGAIATVNSIRQFHSETACIVINCDGQSEGLSTSAIDAFRQANCEVISAERFFVDGRVRCLWSLKSYAFLDVAKSSRYDALVGIDADCVLCSYIGDIVRKCIRTSRFAGGKDDSQEYDTPYSAYGIPVPSVNKRYISTSLLIAPITGHNLGILERWAYSCNNAAYNRTGTLPGYGDQGILNAILFSMHSTVLALSGRVWSQHGTYWSNKIVCDSDEARFWNVDPVRRRQRSFHCAGRPKFWEEGHTENLRKERGSLAGYQWFLQMLFLNGLDSVANCRDSAAIERLWQEYCDLRASSSIA